jgi:hypothetical protein
MTREAPLNLGRVTQQRLILQNITSVYLGYKDVCNEACNSSTNSILYYSCCPTTSMQQTQEPDHA